VSQVQLLTKPDGNVLQTLQDSRVICTALGAAASGVLEKLAFAQPPVRKVVGFASEKDNNLVFYAPKADGTPDTSKPAPQLGVNRQLLRLAGVAGCVAVIENTNSGQLQYVALGVAAVLIARVALDAVPSLQFPARR
jgi:hypothetical protein